MRRPRVSVSSRRRVARTTAGLAFAVVCLSALVGFAPLPDAATRVLVRSASTWISTDYGATRRDGLHLARYVERKFVASLAEYGLAEMFRRHHPVPDEADEVSRIAARLTAVRATILSQRELPHRAGSWPVSLSGIGWCDQINGVVAMILAAEFDPVDLVGVVDPVTGAGHTIGRAWSDDGGQWLYFDVWGDRAVVFTAARQAQVRMLAEITVPSEAPLDASTTALLTRFWQQAPLGVPFNRFGATFGEYLWLKAQRRYREQPPSPADDTPAGDTPGMPRGAVVARSGVVVPPGSLPIDPLPRLAANRFLEARLAQFADDTVAARVAYRDAIHAAAGGPHGALREAAAMHLRRLTASAPLASAPMPRTNPDAPHE